MNKAFYRKWFILAVLFILPVIFLLFLYPSTHNYNTLDIVKENIKEIENLEFLEKKNTTLEENITIVNFLGKSPMNHITSALNLKELVYDKFKGFKKFQILTISSSGSFKSLKEVKNELLKTDELKYWYFAKADDKTIKELFNSFKSSKTLDSTNYISQVYIVDKNRNQRGRIDDREDEEIINNKKIYGLYSYNSIKVSEIKNKMNDDVEFYLQNIDKKERENLIQILEDWIT